MKILMVSMFSIHFFRWVKQLEGAGHEIYWIDVFDSNTYVKEIDFVEQITGWRNRISFPGRYKLKNRFPGFYGVVNKINQRNLIDVFERKLEEIQPDVVQSFVLQSAAFPILEIMKKHPGIKWLYSAWGNDLYFRQQNEFDLQDIKKTLPQLDYMFADCTRDYQVALKHGFKGKYLGTFPTGGGYEFSSYNQFIKPLEERNVIIIKGYQGKLGRCNIVLEAVSELKSELSNFKIIVFGANESVRDFCIEKGLDKWGNLEVKMHISQKEVIELMGQSSLYIGNSISDGMPNTLLEAIIMEAFPIQSNPGGATAELIKNGENGFLIEDPLDVDNIAELILVAIINKKSVQDAIAFNTQNIKPGLERGYIRTKVLNCYRKVESELKL